MQINSQIFKAYDIRGIYPTDINEENIAIVIKAIYVFFTEKISNDRQLKVVLSYDMRLSGDSLFAVAKKTLVDLGAEVIDTGKLSTPSFYYTVSHYHYDCGIQITASHNPPQWNGLKFVINSPKGLIKIGKSTGMDMIKEMSQKTITYTPKYKGLLTPKNNILPDEVKSSLQMLNNPTIKNFKIVADPANAMGATYIEALFNAVSATLIKMNFDLDGNFPAHQPDPLDFTNLESLQNRVIEEKADLGLAPDGDGDRLFFIDEKGQVVSASMITALVAREFLKNNPGETILFDIRYILTPSKIVEENKGKSLITKVGHAFITEALNASGGIFAGESSGHYFFRDTGNAESQLPIILTVLKVLSEEGKTLSELVEEVRRSFESGETNFKVTNANEILETIKNIYKDGELSEIDGISISYNNWRFNMRTSNTEPLLRLNVEALDKNVLDEKVKILKDQITNVAK